MNYRIFLFLFLFSCTSYNVVDKEININFENVFSNSGFAIIYDDKLFKNNIVNKKLSDRSLEIFQRNLKKIHKLKFASKKELSSKAFEWKKIIAWIVNRWIFIIKEKI